MSVTDAYAGNDRIGMQSICADSITVQGNDVKVGTYTYEVNGKTITNATIHDWTLISGSGDFLLNKDSEPIMLGADGKPTLESKDAKETFTFIPMPAGYPDKCSAAEKQAYDEYKTREAKLARYSRNPAAVGLKQGMNTFLYTISNGVCSSSDTLNVFNDRADDAWACGVNNKCDTLFTCDGTIDLNPNSPTYGTGAWRVAAGGSGKFNGNHAYDLAPGINTLVWEISTSRGGECTTRDEVLVQNNAPTESDAGPDDPLTVCGSNSVLSGNKPM